jgi:hypothetical protein
MKLKLTLLILATAASVFAQTTTQIESGTCRQISNCVLPMSDGNSIWVGDPYFVDVLYTSGSPLLGCTNISSYNFNYLTSPPPSASNPKQVDFMLAVSCAGANNVDVIEEGYGYYSNGGGGRGGAGVGVRFSVTSGSVTLH